MDDNTVLLQALRRLDAEAITKIFDLYAPGIYKYAYRHCNRAVEADQIVGDVFAKFMEQLSQGKGPCSNIRSYLFEIAYHAIVDAVRKNQKKVSIDLVELSLTSTNYTDKTAEKHMVLKDILRAIDNDLTVDQRHVIILRIMEGFSIKETALIMGKTITNIKVTQNRAISVIRKALDYEELDYKAELRLIAQQIF